MTVTVKRGAGRPAASARTAKAAQRTVNPADIKTEGDFVEAASAILTGNATVAKAPARKAAPASSVPVGQMTDLELDVALSKVTPGSKREAALKRESVRRADAKPAAKRATRTTPAKATPETPAETQKRGRARNAGIREQEAAQDAKRAVKAAPAKSVAKAPAAKADGSANSKVARLQDGAKANGWKSAVTEKGSKVSVALSRDAEVIVVNFDSGKLDLTDMPSYTSAGRTVKLRNVSQVLSQMEGGRLAVKAAPGRKGVASAASQTPTRKAAAKPREQRFPFDPKSATDDEVRDGVRGRTVRWVNGISRAVEDAVVAATRTIEVMDPKTKKSVEVHKAALVDVAPHPKRNTRVVTFTDVASGTTRSVALDKLIEVS
jgi:hypothetical protein